MKKKIAILILLACLLLTITAQASPAGPAPTYAVQPGVVSGGGYALSALGWRLSGPTQSQSYVLSSPASPGSSENGCCCVYLPCLQKH
jgi:hypothetical protein